MKSSKTRNYIVYIIITTVSILFLFNVVLTFIIHNKLEKLTEKPGRWPAGAYIHDDVIGFDFAPLISDYISDGSFYVKSHNMGYRINKNDDMYNYSQGGVLSLGCSFTYGDEVDCNQTFSQLIADSLNIPAYNYGISSFSYIHALLKAQQLQKNGTLDSLNPKIVVLGCWKGLVNRSKTPYPPLGSNAMKLETSYLTKIHDSVMIKFPSGSPLVFDLAHLYRASDRGLSIRKFVKVFFSTPEIISIFRKNLGKSNRSNFFYNSNPVSEYEVYDYYFSKIEDIFPKDDVRIVVLFMPSVPNEAPTADMIKAANKHPDIIFVDGNTALNEYKVPTSEYSRKHPQPMAHKAYADKIIEKLNQN